MLPGERLVGYIPINCRERGQLIGTDSKQQNQSRQHKLPTELNGSGQAVREHRHVDHPRGMTDAQQPGWLMKHAIT